MSNENTIDQNFSAFEKSSDFCSEDKKYEQTSNIGGDDVAQKPAQEPTHSKNLQAKVPLNFTKEDLVENVVPVFKDNAECDTILQTSKEMKLELEENTHKDLNESSNMLRTQENSAISDVKQILLEVIDNATEKYKMDFTEEENGCICDNNMDLTQDCEEMDTVENGTTCDVGGQKHGLKRLCSDFIFATYTTIYYYSYCITIY